MVHVVDGYDVTVPVPKTVGLPYQLFHYIIHWNMRAPYIHTVTRFTQPENTVHVLATTSPTQLYTHVHMYSM